MFKLKTCSVDYNTKTCENLKLVKTPSLIRECWHICWQT